MTLAPVASLRATVTCLAATVWSALLGMTPASARDHSANPSATAPR